MGSKLDLFHDKGARMIPIRRTKFQRAATIAMVIPFLPAAIPAQALPDATKTAVQASAEERSGQHDFDFLFGHWKVHNRGLVHPLTTGAKEEWVDADGTSVIRPIWGGRANTEEYEAETPPATPTG
jgi:hypothetical protein